MQQTAVQLDTSKGSRVYTPLVLKTYDFIIGNILLALIWRCPRSILLNFYNNFVSAKHLDIGVGTGYFLDHCKFPVSSPEITLVDLNNNALQMTAERIKRYKPKVYQADIYQPLALGNTKFDSVSLCHLLHCLPGNMQDKAKVIENIIPFLNPEAIIFGSTVLGNNVKPSFLAKKVLDLYNEKGIFSNRYDSLESLRSMLSQYFRDVFVLQIGCMAIFFVKQIKSH
jgi:ubiquinone/menaquinone biosynthesis C-methylase UbiE